LGQGGPARQRKPACQRQGAEAPEKKSHQGSFQSSRLQPTASAPNGAAAAAPPKRQKIIDRCMSRQCGHMGARALHSVVGAFFPYGPPQSNKNFVRLWQTGHPSGGRDGHFDLI
jgi:hypothetical protein